MSDCKVHPVVGTVQRDVVAELLGSPFGNFHTDEVDGLVMVDGDRIDFLAVLSMSEGNGAIRRLISECKESYRSVGVWDIWNGVLKDALKRYGFVDARRELISGETVDGMEWTRR